MKFLVLVSLALLMQIHQTLQAPANKNHEKFMLFRVNNFEEDSEEVVVGESYGDKTNKQPSEVANLVLIDKTDLMNLVANENAALETLESVLDNSPPKRYRRQNGESSDGRKLSDNLDQKFNGEKWYEQVVRPVVHAGAHIALGASAANVHDFRSSGREFDRAGVQLGRIGVGRRPEDIPNFQR